MLSSIHYLNPIIVKELLSLARGKRYYLLRAVISIVVLLIAYTTWSDYESKTGIRAMTQLATSLFHSLHGLHYVVSFVLPMLVLCDSISSERRNGTLDLLLTTEIGPREIVLGKYFSRLLILLYANFCLAPMYMLIYLLGGFNAGLLIQSCQYSVVIAVWVGAIAIHRSSLEQSATQSVASTLGETMAFGFALMVLYNWRPPVYLVAALALTAWKLRAAIRSTDSALRDSQSAQKASKVVATRSIPEVKPRSQAAIERSRKVRTRGCLSISLAFFALQLLYKLLGLRNGAAEILFTFPLVLFLNCCLFAIPMLILLATDVPILNRRTGVLDLILLTDLENDEILSGCSHSAWQRARFVFVVLWNLGLLSIWVAPLALIQATVMATFLSFFVLAIGTISCLVVGPSNESRIATAIYLLATLLAPLLTYPMLAYFGWNSVILLALLTVAVVALSNRDPTLTKLLSSFFLVQLTLTICLTTPFQLPEDPSTKQHGPVFHIVAIESAMQSSHQSATADPWQQTFLGIRYCVGLFLSFVWNYGWTQYKFDHIVDRPVKNHKPEPTATVV